MRNNNATSCNNKLSNSKLPQHVPTAKTCLATITTEVATATTDCFTAEIVIIMNVGVQQSKLLA